jgi:hypothetical protein
LPPFYTYNDHFTKTGSGQTYGKLKKEMRFPDWQPFRNLMSALAEQDGVAFQKRQDMPL